jgi:hypothetical protein
MKIRELKKVMNQGWELGKYRMPKSHSKVFLSGLSHRLVYHCGKMTVTEENGVRTWELNGKRIKVGKIW